MVYAAEVLVSSQSVSDGNDNYNSTSTEIELKYERSVIYSAVWHQLQFTEDAPTEQKES